MKIAGDYPDVVIACCGGGSNFAGLAFPFLADQAAGKDVRCLAVEPTSCPDPDQGRLCLRLRRYRQARVPIAMMYTLGHDFMPPGIHAGGLRYHGDFPLVSQLVHAGLIEAKAVQADRLLRGRGALRPTEGIIPAPESSHAIRAAIDEALRPRRRGRRGRSCSTCPATATSTWPPTTPTSPAGWRTTPIRPNGSRRRSPAFPGWPSNPLSLPLGIPSPRRPLWAAGRFLSGASWAPWRRTPKNACRVPPKGLFLRWA